MTGYTISTAFTYMAAVVIIGSGHSFRLEFKYVVETNFVRLSYKPILRSFKT